MQGTGIPQTPLTQWLSTWLNQPLSDEDMQKRLQGYNNPPGKKFNDSLLPPGTTPKAVEQAQNRGKSQNNSPASTPGVNQAFDSIGSEGSTQTAPNVGESLSPSSPITMSQVPSGAVSHNDALRAALFQLGMELATPQYSGLGPILGNTAQSYVRARKGDKQAQQQNIENQLGNQKTQAEIQALEALTNQRKESAQTAKSKRLKGNSTQSTEFERFVSQLDLGPKGSLFLKEQLKDFGDQLIESDVPIEQQFEDLINKARLLDGGGTPEGSDAVNPDTGKTFEIGDQMIGADGVTYELKKFPASSQDNWEAVTG